MADTPELTPAPASDLALEIRDLRVSFRTQNGVVEAVRGVDFDVPQGATLGVVGESGSGKSVSFLAAMGLLPKSAVITGSVKVDGVELIGASRRTMNKVRGQKMAMIFQDPLSALNPVHRVGDQIVEMIQSHHDTDNAAAGKRAVELLDMVGIPQPDERARQYPHELSGGMRQRVMIAMAIANNPSVLIADEPTTALDVTVQAQILEVIDNIRRETNTAVVMITHDLGVIARVADHVQVMYAGRAAERATVSELFRHPTHPYTVGLMQSIPRVGVDRLTPIPGVPPNMLRPPSGCAFRPRCPHAIDACAAAAPEMHACAQSLTACIRSEELFGVVPA